MATKFDIRQSVLRSALGMIGSAVNDTVDTILIKVDPEISKLFEDRNVVLDDGGILTFTGTQVQFTQNLNLVINSRVSGGTPVSISLGSTSRTLNNLDMWYAVIDRTLGTATTTIVSNATGLPAVTSVNQEVFLIAKRVDSADGTQTVYFRNGFAMTSGTTGRLGVTNSGASTFIDNSFNIQNASDNTKKIVFDASAITTGNTRTIKMADSNINLQSIPDMQATFAAGFQGFIDTTTNIITATQTAGTPSVGHFYSSIPGRASIPDLSKDLKPRMGIERIMVQGLYQLQNEFGPTLPVFAPFNDPFGQIRFVGNWFQSLSVDGTLVATSYNADYIEVTFYGTGLNILVFGSASVPTFSIFVDGNSTGTADGSNTNTVLANRNYATNQVLPVVSGLTLGIHTVTLQNSLSATIDISGFELLNESSNVTVSSGIGYIGGNKLVTPSQTQFLYSAPVTGTRGGRVLAYQDSTGTIGKAFQATNASQLNLTSTNHTNEEIDRTYSIREFGAGRSDDFSISNSTSDYYFTLDDGTTTLIGHNVNPTGFTTSRSSLALNSLNAFVTLTFVGTGLDIVRQEDTSALSDTHTVTIDGTNVGNLSGFVRPFVRYEQIVSGLPYGTHTVKIQRTTFTSNAAGIAGFIVYQPKTPSLPAGAVSLGTYNVLADFVVASSSANTSIANELISTGVIRKDHFRELKYSGTSWSIASDNTALDFNRIQTSSTGDYAEYTFFGTGFDFRYFLASNNGVIEIKVDGSTSLTGFTSVVYGGTSFNSSVGQLHSTSTGTGTGGLALTGLTLGTHTVRFTYITGGSAIRVDAFDIVTPIYSSKSTIYIDLQNSLPIGSNSIGDNRNITIVKDSLPSSKAWAQSLGLFSNPSTTSTSPVPMPDMSCTVKTKNGSLRVSYSASVFAGSNHVFTQIYVDGIPVGDTIDTQSQTGIGITSDSIRIPISAGTHKVDIYWYLDGGTGTARNTARSLLVEEV